MVAPIIRKFWVATMLLASPVTSLACSGAERDFDARRDTNIGMLERADLIVLGRVDALPPIDAPVSYEIGLTPIRTLKGQAPTNLILYGTMRDGKELVKPSPTGLHGYHPSSSWGSCDRQGFAPGTLVVAAFVKHPTKGYIQLPERGVEDVEGPDDVWVRAASLYTTIIRTNSSSRRRQAFQKESKRLLAKSGDPDAHAIAEDIADYLQKTAKQ